MNKININITQEVKDEAGKILDMQLSDDPESVYLSLTLEFDLLKRLGLNFQSDFVSYMPEETSVAQHLSILYEWCQKYKNAQTMAANPVDYRLRMYWTTQILETLAGKSSPKVKFVR